MAWQGLGELCVRGGDPDARGGVVDGGDFDVEGGDVRGGEAELDKGGGGDSSSKVSSWERGARTTRGWQGLPWS